MVEQLPVIEQADKLVRLVYDWNYYGAAYALVDGCVSEETRVVVLAMLADKRWDIVKATATQVSDALQLDRSQVASQLLAAKDRAEVFRVVRAVSSNQRWFVDWVVLFTTPDATRLAASAVDGLRAEDSIMSWTLANVLRRCQLDDAGVETLIAVSQDTSPVVRWRAVHALGALPDQKSIEALQPRLDASEDRWVRYGAVRSMVEVAAGASNLGLREAALAVLTDELQRGDFDESMLRELGRALDVDPQPAGWPLSVAPLIQQLIGLSESLAEQEKWGRLMATIISRSRVSA